MGILTRTKKQEKRISLRQNDVLKVVHPRGYVEVFREPVAANEIMKRYPRHCVARHDVFEFPWIVVHPESILVPGKVFYLVPYHTIYILLKAKRQQLESWNPSTKQSQSAKQQERYYSRQPYHHDNYINVVNDLESYCNDSESLYKLSLYKSRMRIILQHIYQGSHCNLNNSSRSGFSLTRTGRENVAKTEHLELPRITSCLRKADSKRKKLDLKVSFASPVVVLGSRRGSQSVKQDDLSSQVYSQKSQTMRCHHFHCWSCKEE